MSKRVQTTEEEIANTITHGAGVVFAVFAIPVLMIYAFQLGSLKTVWSVGMFSFGMLMVYCSSTLYHAIQHPGVKHKLRIWDHISIFYLIAGSYTPIIHKYVEADTATFFLTTLWIIVGLGTIMKLFFTGRFGVFSLLLYLVLGCFAVFIYKPLAANVPMGVLVMMLLGGLSYLLGVIFYAWKNLRYQHAIWHVFVLAGTVIHYFAVYYSVPFKTI
jgi:hemolysin III